jgi:type I restriction enzyme S subunit
VNYQQDTLFVDSRTHESFARSQIKPGDVLVSIAGTIGRVGVVPPDAPALNCNQAVAIARTNGEVFRPFLRHWLESVDAQSQMRGATVTGTISNLSLSQLGSLRVPLPPMAEQRRIAEVLERTEALRAKRRAGLAQLNTLSQAIFLEMFGDPGTNPKGWKTVRLQDVTTKIGSGATPTGGSASYTDSGIALIRSMNVRDGEFTRKDLARINSRQAAKLDIVEVHRGDVLLNITGASVARVCLVPDEVLPARVNQHVCIIRTKDALESAFSEQLLLNASTKRRLLRSAESGATRQAITKAQLEAFELICPRSADSASFPARLPPLTS